MIRVRYPNGLVVTYNRAGFLRHGDGGWHLYTDNTASNWVASIQPSSGAIIESHRPCSIHTEGRVPADQVRALLNDRLEDLPDHLLADLKSRLQDFDARRRCWK